MGDRGRGRGSPSGARGRCEARRRGRVLRERSQRRGLGLADALHEQGARGRDGREGVREEQERGRKKRRLVYGANERRSGRGWNRKVGWVKARCDQVARREMRARARHGAANGWLSHRRVGPWSRREDLGREMCRTVLSTPPLPEGLSGVDNPAGSWLWSMAKVRRGRLVRSTGDCARTPAFPVGG